VAVPPPPDVEVPSWAAPTPAAAEAVAVAAGTLAALRKSRLFIQKILRMERA
jgi:hypothetical protein